MAFSGRAWCAGRLAATGALAVTLALVLLPGSASARSALVPRSAGPASAASGQTSIALDGPAYGVAVDPDTDTAYTVSGTTLQVIDVATGSVTATVPVSPGAESLAVDPDTDMIYVVNTSGDSISVIDGASNTVTATVGLTGLPSDSLYGIAVDESTDLIYVGTTNIGDVSGSGGVTVINGATNSVTGTISTGVGDPYSVSVDPVTDTLYEAFYEDENLYVINAATESVTSVIDSGNFPEAIAVDPVTNMFYVANYDETVTAYSGASDAAVATVSIGGLARDIAVDPDTNTIYAAPTITGNNVTVISGADNEISATIPENVSGPIAVDPDTDTVLPVTDDPSTSTWYLTVIPLQAPSITSSAASATFDPDQAGVFTFTATGTPTPAFSETGALPPGVTLSSSGALEGTPAPQAVGSYPITVSAANGIAPAATQAFTLNVAPTLYTPVAPTRFLDTRVGLGAAKGAVLPGADLTVQLPDLSAASAVSAVAVNVTAVAPTASGTLTVFTAAGTGGSTSNVAFSAGQTVAGLVTVAPSEGAITIQNNSGGTVQVIADLDGYYSSAGSGFQGVAPVRVMDTRSGLGTAKGPVPSKGAARLDLSGDVPAGATAAVLNLTATAPTAAGDVIAYADGQQLPGTSNLNFSAGQTVANQVIVPLTNGIADFYNGSSGSVQLIADLSGYYAPGSPGSFVPFGPTRIVDTRIGLGVKAGAIPADGTLLVPASAVAIFDTCSAAGCSPFDQADVINVTVTAPQAAGVLTVYPAGQSLPGTSSVNFTAGQTVATPVVVQDLSRNGFAIYNASTGTVQVVVDEQGYFMNQP